MMTRTSAARFLLASLLMSIGWGCSHSTPEGPVVPPAPAELTTEDVAVLEAAFAAFLRDPEANARGSQDATQLILHPETEGPRVAGGPTQMSGDLRALRLPPAAMRDIGRRNGTPVSVRDFKAQQLDLVVADLTDLQADFSFYSNFREKHPQARAYIATWLPGYSRDGSTAVARFMFSPTPHGATATYLLKRESGRWKVVKGNITYYL